jgi:transposase
MDKKKIEELLETLKRQRDELALKIHLGKAEARDEWEKLEKKLAELKAQATPVGSALGETAKGVGTALELAGEEIKKGYDRIRKLLG